MQTITHAKLFGDREDPRRRLQDIFGGELRAGVPPEAAVAWALSVLGDDAAEHAADPTEMIARLRRAERRLTLRASAFLVAHIRRG